MAALPLRVGVLTSSRADFGIYLPLLKKMQNDSFFDLKLIVLGSHLSPFHGYTVKTIEAEGFAIDAKIESLLTGDSREAIATAMSLTMMKFSQYWGAHANQYDIVLCLGDRYEMFAAVTAGVPFGVKFAHLHGGEKTLGAIDNFFRHSISQAAWCHFASTAAYAERLTQMLDEPERIYNVGALSLDSLADIAFLSKEQIKSKWNIDMAAPTILVTFHPETVNVSENVEYAGELVKTFITLSRFQIVITMPNADTLGATVRNIFIEKLSGQRHIVMVENLGTQGYFSVIHHCVFLLGNTSSGIIEAASLGKYVINVGDRQKGRMQSDNVLNVPVSSEAILKAVDLISAKGNYTGENIYYQNGSAEKICNSLKQLFY
jgi:GDP/UDP-N,N'-diacetylbacillosamine 2-epimerase (hydrolysing)